MGSVEPVQHIAPLPSPTKTPTGWQPPVEPEDPEVEDRLLLELPQFLHVSEAG